MKDKKKVGMPSKEIKLWAKASFKTVVFEV
jgi:hypothetical protein